MLSKNLQFEAWGIQLSKEPSIQSICIQRLETGAFKVVREYNGYCVQCTFQIYLPFSKFFKDPWSHAIVMSPLNSSNFEPVPIYLELSFILFAKFLLFLMAIPEAKIFKKIQNFLHLLKSVNNKHTLFELVSS
jgi:hypothetical protein